MPTENRIIKLKWLDRVSTVSDLCWEFPEEVPAVGRKETGRWQKYIVLLADRCRHRRDRNRRRRIVNSAFRKLGWAFVIAKLIRLQTCDRENQRRAPVRTSGFRLLARVRRQVQNRQLQIELRASNSHRGNWDRYVRVPLARIGILLTVIILIALSSTTAFAHGVLKDGANPWTTWTLTPDFAIGALLVTGIYANGLSILRHKTDSARVWRHVSFFTGLAAVFLALQSPIDPIAERSFFFHQIQHFLIRMIGPMLIFLSAPQGILVAGMPDRIQHYVVNPVISNQIVRGFLDVMGQPVIATTLFIGTFFFWQIPRIHDLALLNDYVHYLMHVSLLFTGFIFFWRILDSRPVPTSMRYGVRLMMLWIMVLSNIIIGSYLAFKGNVLYTAYDELGRLWNSPLTDEQLGAVTIWIPNSMMGLVAILIVVHMWGRQETRDDRRRTAKLARHGYGWNEPPMTAAELIAQAAPKNRVMAYGLAAFVLCVFAIAIMIGLINQVM